jgi:predicted nucleic acid-binding protein
MAYLNDEPGGKRVQEILALAQQEKVRICFCYINLGELLYLTERHRGLSQAQRVLALIESLPIQLLDATRELILDAAHIKARYAISYADSFVVAAAQQENATILTGDPEFQSTENLAKIEWLDSK